MIPNILSANISYALLYPIYLLNSAGELTIIRADQVKTCKECDTTDLTQSGPTTFICEDHGFKIQELTSFTASFKEDTKIKVFHLSKMLMPEFNVFLSSLLCKAHDNLLISPKKALQQSRILEIFAVEYLKCSRFKQNSPYLCKFIIRY